MGLARLVGTGALVALAAVGCKRGEEPGQVRAATGRGTAGAVPQGQLLAGGRAVDLRVMPDGRYVTFLMDAKKPAVDGLPPKMVQGVLHVAPAEGGEPLVLGSGVTNDVGGLLFTPDSRHVLFLTDFQPRTRSGALNVHAPGSAGDAVVRLGASVSYMVPSPDGATLAFVDGGVLKVGPLPAGPFRDVAGEVSTAEFTPDGKSLLFKRRLSAAGGLAVVAGQGVPVKLADQVGEYQLSPDGKRVAYQVRSESVRGMYDLFLAELPAGPGRRIATGTTVFGFSRDGQWLARTDGARPEVRGDLLVGPANGEGGRKVGSKVEEFAFSPDSKAVGFLDSYDLTARAGLMGVVALPDGEPRKVGSRVPNFTWGADGGHVAFISRFIKPVFSLDLMLYPVGAPRALKVHPGVFGYGFSPGNADVVFRTNCIREGRACDFKAVPLPLPPVAEAPAATDASGKAEAPKPPGLPEAHVWLQGIYSYKFSRDGERALVSYARMDSDSYDVAVYDLKTRQRRTLEERVDIPAYFAGKDDARVVYLVTQGPKPGVYTTTATP